MVFPGRDSPSWKESRKIRARDTRDKGYRKRIGSAGIASRRG